MPRENDSQFTQISPSMTITGDLSGSSDLRIAGTVKGNIATTGDVVIEESGNIEGTIKTKLLVIQCGAKLKGNCNVSVETETKKS